MRKNRDNLKQNIKSEEEEKSSIVKQMDKLNIKLNILNKSLEQKFKDYTELEKTLEDTETGLQKVSYSTMRTL